MEQDPRRAIVAKARYALASWLAESVEWKALTPAEEYLLLAEYLCRRLDKDVAAERQEG